MKKHLVSAIIATSLFTAPVMSYAKSAEESDKLAPESVEGIGLTTGMIVGAVFGGPAGAFITGIAGTLIAKNINNEDTITELEIAKQNQQESFQSQLAHLKSSFAEKEQDYQSELIALEQNQVSSSQMMLTKLQADNLLMSLQFKTGSSAIPEYYQAQISGLAQLINQADAMSVELSGYTDLLGDSDLNMKLSSERATAVKDALIAQGVDAAKIKTFAYGDSQPVVANNQSKSSYYDRRVMIKLHQQPSQVAKNY